MVTASNNKEIAKHQIIKRNRLKPVICPSCRRTLATVPRGTECFCPKCKQWAKTPMTEIESLKREYRQFKSSMKATAKHIITIGAMLSAAKNKLPEKHYLEILRQAGISEGEAEGFIKESNAADGKELVSSEGITGYQETTGSTLIGALSGKEKKHRSKIT